MMVIRRPYRSEMRPHPSAPIAAAKASGGGVHAEFAAHGFERAVDHSGVVAEEQSAEGGDEGNDAEVSAVLPGAQRGQGGGGALCAHGVL